MPAVFLGVGSGGWLGGTEWLCAADSPLLRGCVQLPSTCRCGVSKHSLLARWLRDAWRAYPHPPLPGTFSRREKGWVRAPATYLTPGTLKVTTRTQCPGTAVMPQHRRNHSPIPAPNGQTDRPSRPGRSRQHRLRRAAALYPRACALKAIANLGLTTAVVCAAVMQDGTTPPWQDALLIAVFFSVPPSVCVVTLSAAIKWITGRRRARSPV